ncbi:hypothetical protein [Lacticaseibacillus sharpeae]|nr:hypothetical protein [Lacticaseibacillus sharpeae]
MDEMIDMMPVWTLGDGAWVDWSDFTTMDVPVSRRWNSNFKVRQTIVDREIGMKPLTRITNTNGSGVYAANYLRYALEVVDTTQSGSDRPLILIMKNPSFATVCEADDTAALAQRLLSIKGHHQYRYNHLIILNLSPVVCSQAFRLHGDISEIDANHAKKIQIFDVDHIEKSAANPRSSLEFIKGNRNIFDQTLNLNAEFIKSVFMELIHKKVIYDVMIATGSLGKIGTSIKVNGKSKFFSLDDDGVNKLVNEYSQIMNMISENFVLNNDLQSLSKADPNLPSYKLMATEVMSSKEGFGYAKHTSSIFGRGSKVDSSWLPTCVTYSGAVVSVNDGGLRPI